MFHLGDTPAILTTRSPFYPHPSELIATTPVESGTGFSIAQLELLERRSAFKRFTDSRVGLSLGPRSATMDEFDFKQEAQTLAIQEEAQVPDSLEAQNSQDASQLLVALPRLADIGALLNKAAVFLLIYPGLDSSARGGGGCGQ